MTTPAPAVPPIRRRADAAELDASDPLAAARDRFTLPAGVTYLVGHSLGPATHAALEAVRRTGSEDWAQGLVRSWNTAGWIDLAEATGNRLARLIGAAPGEVVIADSVSVNLFKLGTAVMPLARDRRITVEDDEFPTDQYIAEGLARTVGVPFDRIPSDAAMAAIDTGGVVLKSLVNYRSGAVADMAAWEAAAARSGAVIIWDLSHAAGVLPVNLAGDGARVAAGCTYKYLNGGPGAPSFVYARRDVADILETPLPGWLGHAAPFAFSAAYDPAPGALRFVCGTPPILSLAALDGALAAFEGLSMTALVTKARALGEICLTRGEDMGLTLASPRDANRRGGHVSLRHPQGYAIVQALAARGVLADFRTPDTIRLGLSPLFLGYAEIWDAMDALEDILNRRLYDDAAYRTRAKVT